MMNNPSMIVYYDHTDIKFTTIRSPFRLVENVVLIEYNYKEEGLARLTIHETNRPENYTYVYIDQNLIRSIVLA